MGERPAEFDRQLVGYQGFLKKMAVRLGTPKGIREELVQDTLTAALAGWHRYDPTRSMSAWLVYIMREIAHRRRILLRTRAVHVEFGETRAYTEPTQEAAGDLAMVCAKLSRMPKEVSSPIIRLAMGESCAVIADDYGITPQGVSARVQRGREQLRGQVRLKQFSARGRAA